MTLTKKLIANLTNFRKMRIKAKIEISNRSLAVHNMSGRKGKDAQALLAIGKKPKGLTQSTLKESNKVRFNKFIKRSLHLSGKTF